MLIAEAMMACTGMVGDTFLKVCFFTDDLADCRISFRASAMGSAWRVAAGVSRQKATTVASIQALRVIARAVQTLCHKWHRWTKNGKVTGWETRLCLVLRVLGFVLKDGFYAIHDFRG